MLIRGALIVLSVYWTGYWITGLAVAVLLLVWELLGTLEGPPVLALALSYQWMQVTIGIFYAAVTGIQLPAMIETDWQTMVLIGLGCITCLAVGLFYGITLMRRRLNPPDDAPVFAFSNKLLYAAYAASLLLTGAVQELASGRLSRLHAGDSRDYVLAPGAAVPAHPAVHASRVSVAQAGARDGHRDRSRLHRLFRRLSRTGDDGGDRDLRGVQPPRRASLGVRRPARPSCSACRA